MKDKISKVWRSIIYNRFFVMTWLIVGFIYITAYGFLLNPLVYTASMIGLKYPLAFKFWGVISAISLALNINYAYKRYGYKGKPGYISMALGAVCIMTTVHIPSTEIMGLQLIAHWGTALLFAIFFAAAIILLLLKFVKRKPFKNTLIAFGCCLALMLILLAAFGKNGVIESIPMWAAYVILFLINFTSVYVIDNKKAENNTASVQKVADTEKIAPDDAEDGAENK